MTDKTPTTADELIALATDNHKTSLQMIDTLEAMLRLAIDQRDSWPMKDERKACNEALAKLARGEG